MTIVMNLVNKLFSLGDLAIGNAAPVGSMKTYAPITYRWYIIQNTTWILILTTIPSFYTYSKVSYFCKTSLRCSFCIVGRGEWCQLFRLLAISIKLIKTVFSVTERFVQVLVNSTPLHVLNVCEVCGSYQCPYCPHYSTAPHCRSFHSFFGLLNLVCLFVSIFDIKVFI